MLFNSLEFLVFFPIVTILYFLLPHKYRWFHLLVASCIFYMYFIPVYILILFFTIIIDYIAGILIENQQGEKRKFFLVMSLIANIGVLAIFKYYNFFAENINGILDLTKPIPLLTILLPIGLSFHTFQAMSYTIEVYRGNHKAERHFGIYALYVMFYPQLVAGPIERPQNVLYQFHERKYFNYENVVRGLRLILWGMFKKVVIADNLALFTNPVFNDPQNHSAISILIAAVFFSFQIFCDFSGYSDIALGTARVMGFHLMTNFNKPYFARSIAEFWKRWHISLSTWFKDYLYIPLGGNRVSIPKSYFNIFVVFLVSGLWHGASWTFVLWGALHGFYTIFGAATKKYREKFVGHFAFNHSIINIFNVLITFSLVTLAWIFFRAETLGNAFFMIKKMLLIPLEINYIGEADEIITIDWLMKSKGILLGITLILFLISINFLQLKFDIQRKFESLHVVYRWVCYYIAIMSIYVLGVFEEQQFIYFQF